MDYAYKNNRHHVNWIKIQTGFQNSFIPIIALTTAHFIKYKSNQINNLTQVIKEQETGILKDRGVYGSLDGLLKRNLSSNQDLNPQQCVIIIHLKCTLEPMNDYFITIKGRDYYSRFMIL